MRSMKIMASIGVTTTVAMAAIGVGMATPASATSLATATSRTQHLVTTGKGWGVYGSGARSTTRPVALPSNLSSQQLMAKVRPMGVGNWCGWSHCSIIIYRGTTKSIDAKVARYANQNSAAIAGAFAIACSPLGGVGAIVCGAIGAVAGGRAIDQFNYAAAHNQCISIDYIPTPGVPSPYNIRPLNDSNCHN